MDYSILIALGFVVLIISLGCLTKYLIKKGYIALKDLEQIDLIIAIGVEVIDELNLKKEKEILSITHLIQEALDYCIKISTDENRKAITLEYVFALCKKHNIDLTKKRINLITQLVVMTIEKENVD